MKGLSGGSKRVHVAIVLDRSGSMESCRAATIAGFNEYLDGIRETAEREELQIDATFVAFNQEVSVHYVDAPLARLKRLTPESYVPGGMTAMLDAVGETIERLGGSDAEGTYLVCTISDGLENSSERFTYSDIAERIQWLTATGRWTFTYLGANQDLSQVSQNLGIAPGFVAAYVATPSGTNEAWDRHRARSVRHLESVARDMPAAPFYEEES
jgi:uncharacterized protein YegL